MEVKEAADLLDNLIGMIEDSGGRDYDTALKMGIEALSANGDIIYRQAALDMEFSNGISEDGVLYVPYREVKMNLEELPSAQPEIIRCKDCKHYDEESCDRYADETLGYEHSTQPEFYCAVAERRTDETD